MSGLLTLHSRVLPLNHIIPNNHCHGVLRGQAYDREGGLMAGLAVTGSLPGEEHTI